MQLNRLHPALLIFIGATALIWPAFYNGFPLVYSDTGTYLESGFTLETPLDRPITYGVLIRIFSLNGLTIWTVPFFQTCILSLLIFWTIESTVSDTLRNRIYLIATGVLATFTGLPLVCSDLIADIFTPVCVLTIYLLLFHNHAKGKTAVLYLILLFAAACHISHIIILGAIIGCVALVRLIQYLRKRPAPVPGVHLLVSLLVIAAAFTTMMSSVSKSRHVFMMGHLVETGILQAYLDDHCGDENISLCSYRDRLPQGAESFIWNSNGNDVLMNTGGWIGSKDEYSRIISATFREPLYLKMHLWGSFTGTLRQLTSVRVSEGMGNYDSTQLVTQRMQKYFPREFPLYSASRQSADEFAGTPVIDRLNRITLLAALVIFILVMNMRPARPLRTLGIVIAGGYVLNCMICATLATVAHRFGTRLSWLFVLFAIIAIVHFLQRKRRNSAD